MSLAWLAVDYPPRASLPLFCCNLVALAIVSFVLVSPSPRRAYYARLNEPGPIDSPLALRCAESSAVEASRSRTHSKSERTSRSSVSTRSVHWPPAPAPILARSPVGRECRCLISKKRLSLKSAEEGVGFARSTECREWQERWARARVSMLARCESRGGRGGELGGVDAIQRERERECAREPSVKSERGERWERRCVGADEGQIRPGARRQLGLSSASALLPRPSCAPRWTLSVTRCCCPTPAARPPTLHTAQLGSDASGLGPSASLVECGSRTYTTASCNLRCD